MENFDDFLNTIDCSDQKERLVELFSWIETEFPNLEKKIAWNQPMYTDHGTFIIGFSTAKKHIAVAPERTALYEWEDAITAAGYDMTKELFKIKWTDTVNYDLLRKVIAFNIQDKADHTKFWR